MSIAKVAMIGRKNVPKTLYAPKGVEIRTEGESWIISSHYYRSTHSYSAVRFTKGKWRVVDRAMRAFLHNYGTAAQKAEFAASGRECPASWSVIKQPQKPVIAKPVPHAKKHLTQKQKDEIGDIVDEVFDGSGIDGIAFGEDGDNPYAFMVFIPIDVDKGFVVYSCNKLFHQLGLLPHNKGLLMGEVVDYCGIVRGGGADGECYVASFNHPIVLGFEESDPRSRFILKNWRECDGDDAD